MAGLRVGVCIVAAAAALASRDARLAHGAGPGGGSDIEMPGDPPAEVDPDAPPVKDPKAAKKWLAAVTSTPRTSLGSFTRQLLKVMPR